MRALTLRALVAALLAAGPAHAQQMGGSPATAASGVNLLQNGDCAIDQRHQGASVTYTTGFTTFVDRWQGEIGLAQGGAGAPTIARVAVSAAGVPASTACKITTGSAGTSVPAGLVFENWQAVEGSDVADLGWGSAQPVELTASLWLQSSIAAAKIGVSLQNAAGTRSFVHMCAVPVAASWTYCSFPVPGDGTAGASGWTLTVNNIGVYFGVDGGLGSTYQAPGTDQWEACDCTTSASQTQFTLTAGATLAWTAAKLERGTSATPFVPDPAATAMAKLRRYYRTSYPEGAHPGVTTYTGSGTQQLCLQNPAASAYPSLQASIEGMYVGPTPTEPTVTWYNPKTGASGGSAALYDWTTAATLVTTVSMGVSAIGPADVATVGNVVCVEYAADTGL